MTEKRKMTPEDIAAARAVIADAPPSPWAERAFEAFCAAMRGWPAALDEVERLQLTVNALRLSVAVKQDENVSLHVECHDRAVENNKLRAVAEAAKELYPAYALLCDKDIEAHKLCRALKAWRGVK